MSHPQPPNRLPTDSETNQYRSIVHNVALASLVVCPILVILPPRKFDAYTIGLLGMTAVSGNHLYREQTGRSFLQDLRPSSWLMPTGEAANSSLPTDRAREFQKHMKAQKEARLAAEGQAVETAAETPAADGQKQGVLEQVWMGKEKEGWQAKREKEVQEALAEGKGYGDIIMDQIWEVWNWGKKGDETKPDEEKSS
ncbi:hypothetical protein M8818_000383 [Zalaria obscura]|uniref:Uncharacterized protein n=1 Tax=Zalaria obscura TaxID=2024903 RepID=A0ACC3SN98_9PEZI